MDKKFRVVSYCRVSSLDQVASVLTVRGSLQEQEAKARSYASSQGWEYVKTYIEPGLSGEKFEERLALQQMLVDAKEGAFELVMVTAGDRLARDQEVFFRITKILNQVYNIQILNLANPSQIVEPEAFNGRRNPMLIVQQGFDAMMAAFDQARRTDMLIEGLKRQVKAGRFIYSRICYGYKIETRVIGGVKIERVPVPDPDEYWVVELLPDLVLEEHLSDYEIAERLDKLGAKPRNSPHWTKVSIRRMLMQHFYAGKIGYGLRGATFDEDGTVQRRQHTKEANIIYADHNYAHPWTLETFYKLQNERKARSIMPPRQVVSRSPLAGLIKCEVCGHPLQYNNGSFSSKVIDRIVQPDGTVKRITKDGRRKAPFYYCTFGLRTSANPKCKGSGVRASFVMGAIQANLDALLTQETQDPENFYRTLKNKDSQDRKGQLAQQLSEVSKELKDGIPAQLDRLNRGFLKGSISDEQYASLTQIIVEEKTKLEDRLTGLQEQLKRVDAANFQEERVNRFFRNYERLRSLFEKEINEWSQIEVRTVKAALTTFFESITVRVDRPGKYQKGKIFISFEQKSLV